MVFVSVHGVCVCAWCLCLCMVFVSVHGVWHVVQPPYRVSVHQLANLAGTMTFYESEVLDMRELTQSRPYRGLVSYLDPNVHKHYRLQHSTTYVALYYKQ